MNPKALAICSVFAVCIVAVTCAGFVSDCSDAESYTLTWRYAPMEDKSLDVNVGDTVTLNFFTTGYNNTSTRYAVQDKPSWLAQSGSENAPVLSGTATTPGTYHANVTWMRVDSGVVGATQNIHVTINVIAPYSDHTIVYDGNGEEQSREPVYEDGAGTITFNGDGGFTWHEDQSESGEDMVFERLEAAFAYIHDPRENPEAMADIVEDPEAVYGFSPNPASRRLGEYAEYNWSDPEFVASARESRRAYHVSLETMTDILYRMREEGASTEEMARAVSEERNRLRLAAYDDDPEGLALVKESNLKTYGHEDGPTPDQLYEKYGSWTAVMQKAFSTNMGMDVCCGLYDEYYWLYIELGYVE